eukprot:scaffold92256_cov13-Tisochrysis_lutea.AAC.1
MLHMRARNVFDTTGVPWPSLQLSATICISQPISAVNFETKNGVLAPTCHPQGAIPLGQQVDQAAAKKALALLKCCDLLELCIPFICVRYAATVV